VDPHLKQLQEEIELVTAGLSAEELSWHPAGKWCAAEILEHLYLTYTGTVKGFERVAAAGKTLATGPTVRQRGRRWVVLGLGYLPSGREAPSFARPRGLPQEKVLGEIQSKIGEMDEMIRQCEAKLGARSNLLDHPILGPLTGSEWRKFHLVHGRHHVKQIRRLREGAL
jgi:hypothetical protein